MRTKLVSSVAVVCACLVAGACQKAGTAVLDIEKASDDQKALYAIGRMLGTNVARLQLTDAELAYVNAGLADAAQGRAERVDMQKAGQLVPTFQRARMAQSAGPEKEASRAFLDKEAGQPGAKRLPSGLVFRTVKEGSGPNPAVDDTVVVNYVGTLRDGTEFDSSYKPRPGQSAAQPVNFRLNQVVPCWTEALQLMKVGGSAHVSCPSDMAYGDGGAPPKILPGAALAFDVELLAIAPREGAAPPAAAKPHK